jgi:hypothetical protein
VLSIGLVVRRCVQCSAVEKIRLCAGGNFVIAVRGMERIIIEPARIIGEHGQQYRVHYRHNLLVQRTWNPEYDAARALFALDALAMSRSGVPARRTPTASFMSSGPRR